MRETIQQVKLLTDYGSAKKGTILQRGSEKDRQTHTYRKIDLFWDVESNRMDNRFIHANWLNEGDYVVLEEDLV